ncbi:MAG TPA: TolC family protein [Phycisphaerae bacterium]|nr:TolC family protein [Phycisphaerae bacterium]HNU45447.1 TolC family protein [Phycisphaerae bacterium]
MLWTPARRRHRATVAGALALAVGACSGACRPAPPSAALLAKRPPHVRHAPGTPAWPAAAGAEVQELPVLDERAGLHDYLTYAALNNPGLKAAFARWQAAVERVPQARALADPQLTYRHMVAEAGSPLEPREQSVELSQMLPWPGKRGLQGALAAAAAQGAWEELQEQRLALFYEVQDAYYEYYYLGQALEVVRQNVELVRQLESVARVRYRAAAAGHPEVIRAQVELGRVEDQLRTLEDERAPVQARLNAALNRAPHRELPVPPEIGQLSPSLAEAEVLARLATSSPTLRVLDAEIELARQAVTLARKGYFPDFMVGFEYTSARRADDPPLAGWTSPEALGTLGRLRSRTADPLDVYGLARGLRGGEPSDEDMDSWAVLVSMNLPIWAGKYAAGVREAEAQYRSALSARAQRQNALQAQVKRVLFAYRDAQRKVELYGATLLPKARESLQATQTAFQAGSASFLDLVDAERTLLEFGLAHARARADRAQRLAELEMLMGQPWTTLPGLRPDAQPGTPGAQPAPHDVPLGETGD